MRESPHRPSAVAVWKGLTVHCYLQGATKQKLPSEMVFAAATPAAAAPSGFGINMQADIQSLQMAREKVLSHILLAVPLP